MYIGHNSRLNINPPIGVPNAAVILAATAVDNIYYFKIFFLFNLNLIKKRYLLLEIF